MILVPLQLCKFTLLGWMARRRFSIHLSLSAAERQEKHLLPVEVLTWKKKRAITVSLLRESHGFRLAYIKGKPVPCFNVMSKDATEKKQNVKLHLLTDRLGTNAALKNRVQKAGYRHSHKVLNSHHDL